MRFVFCCFRTIAFVITTNLLTLMIINQFIREYESFFKLNISDLQCSPRKGPLKALGFSRGILINATKHLFLLCVVEISHVVPKFSFTCNSFLLEPVNGDFSQSGGDGQISQVVSNLCQVLVFVHGIHVLQVHQRVLQSCKTCQIIPKCIR